MSLPPGLSGMPPEEQHKYFRNVCIEFKKKIQSTTDLEALQIEMQRFLDAGRQVRWPSKKSSIFHKDENEKAAQKVWREFKRYIETLEKNPEAANPQDLLDALANVETLIGQLKVR